MSDYPTLDEMGVTHPETIDRYSVQTINNIDILRIVYKKEKGSILPDSKRFRFPQVEKMAPGDSAIYREVSPVVNKAMAELDQIVKVKRERGHQLEVIREEIRRLQEETSTRIEYINSLAVSYTHLTLPTTSRV